MSKVKTFSRWFKHFSSLGDAALEQAIVSVFDRAERAEAYKELDQNPDIDMHDMVCCIAYADHCTAPLLARIADLEAALTMRPISEAPQDGTQYLAWNGVSYMVLNQPDESYSIGEWEFVGGEWIGHHVGHHPTYFLPLPASPKGDAA